jgi:very-short-patch-repair endonuclease
MGLVSKMYFRGKKGLTKKQRREREKLNKHNKLSKLIRKAKVVVPEEIRIERDRFALTLNENLPKSEQWFQEKYRDHKHYNDLFNIPIGYYIPDVSNNLYKYILEIDGSIHDLEEIKVKDLKKEQYYNQNGYRVIRVKAYCDDCFKRAIFILDIIRKKFFKKGVPRFTKQQEINNYRCAGISCTHYQGHHIDK